MNASYIGKEQPIRKWFFISSIETIYTGQNQLVYECLDLILLNEGALIIAHMFYTTRGLSGDFYFFKISHPISHTGWKDHQPVRRSLLFYSRRGLRGFTQKIRYFKISNTENVSEHRMLDFSGKCTKRSAPNYLFIMHI